MNLEEYQKLCKETATDFENRDKELMNWGLGVAGEAGDLAGCIKKIVTHKNNQKEGVRENIGDTLWYMAMICNFYGWNLGEVLEENIKKLKERYPDGFTEEDAQRNGTRIDWMEE